MDEKLIPYYNHINLFEYRFYYPRPYMHVDGELYSEHDLKLSGSSNAVTKIILTSLPDGVSPICNFTLVKSKHGRIIYYSTVPLSVYDVVTIDNYLIKSNDIHTSIVDYPFFTFRTVVGNTGGHIPTNNFYVFNHKFPLLNASNDYEVISFNNNLNEITGMNNTLHLSNFNNFQLYQYRYLKYHQNIPNILYDYTTHNIYPASFEYNVKHDQHNSIIVYIMPDKFVQLSSTSGYLFDETLNLLLYFYCKTYVTSMYSSITNLENARLNKTSEYIIDDQLLLQKRTVIDAYNTRSWRNIQRRLDILGIINYFINEDQQLVAWTNDFLITT